MKQAQSTPVLSLSDVEAMMRLLATAADPTVPMPLADRKRSLAEGMANLVGADAWVWIVGVRNPRLRGDAMVINLVDGGWLNERERADLLRVIVHPDLAPVVTNRLHDAMLQHRCITLSRDQLLPDKQWHATSTGQIWRSIGFDHFILSAYPLGEAAHSAFGFYRRLGKPAFTQRDRTIIHVIVQQVDWLHREGNNVPASQHVIDLSPRERQVLLLLIGGDSRKQVAAKLGLSQHTVADYVKEIYRKLDVRSRAQLLAKFIAGKG